MKEASKARRREALLRRSFTFGDAVLVFLVLAVAVTMIARPWGEKARGSAVEVVVEVNGKEAMRLPLTGGDGDYRVEGFRGSSLFRVEGGEVWMVDSACPDKLCVGMGHVREAGQAVVCLPNRVTLRLEGSGGTDVVQR